MEAIEIDKTTPIDQGDEIIDKRFPDEIFIISDYMHHQKAFRVILKRNGMSDFYIRIDSLNSGGYLKII